MKIFGAEVIRYKPFSDTFKYSGANLYPENHTIHDIQHGGTKIRTQQRKYDVCYPPQLSHQASMKPKTPTHLRVYCCKTK